MTVRTTTARIVAGAALLLLLGTLAWGQSDPTTQPIEVPGADVLDRTEAMPEAFENVGVDEHLDTQLPLDLPFTDHSGQDVTLGKYFDGERPVILTLNYYRCQQLCSLQLNALVDAMKDMEWVPGKQFEIVTVSFDPLEDYRLATIKRRTYLEHYGRPEAASGWHFLTGSKASIDKLLETTGVRVKYDPKTNEWAHTAVLIINTPNGRISRYLGNIVYEPRTLRLSLVEASEGKIGSPFDQVLLYCYHFDGEGYSLSAFNIVRGGAVLTALVLGTVLLILWRRERRRGKLAEATS